MVIRIWAPTSWIVTKEGGHGVYHRDEVCTQIVCVLHQSQTQNARMHTHTQKAHTHTHIRAITEMTFVHRSCGFYMTTSITHMPHPRVCFSSLLGTKKHLITHVWTLTRHSTNTFVCTSFTLAQLGGSPHKLIWVKMLSKSAYVEFIEAKAAVFSMPATKRQKCRLTALCQPVLKEWSFIITRLCSCRRCPSSCWSPPSSLSSGCLATPSTLSLSSSENQLYCYLCHLQIIIHGQLPLRAVVSSSERLLQRLLLPPVTIISISISQSIGSH